MPCQTIVQAGVHRFEGHGTDGSSVPQNVYLTPGATVPLFFDVLPAHASIRVAAADPNTLIYIDGAYVGKGAWHGSVPPGRHALVLRRSTGEVLQQTLDVAAGMNYAIRDNPAIRPSAGPRTAPVPPGPQSAVRVPVVSQPPTSPTAASAPVYNSQATQMAPPYGYSSGAASTPTAGGSSANYGQNGFAGATGTDEAAFRGITGAVFAPIILGGPSTNAYGSKCPATDFGGTCTTSGPRGGAIALQLGYSNGWIAPEAMLGLSLDVSSAGLQLPADFQITGDTTGMLAQIAGDTKFMRIGILGALGARMSTVAQGRRFTFSGVFGVVKRSVYIIPDSFFGTRPSYTAPTLFFDSGFIFGDTPGVKVYGGLFLWLEFVPTRTISRDVTKVGLQTEYVPESLRTITPFHGMQIMFGPLIGVTFGH